MSWEDDDLERQRRSRSDRGGVVDAAAEAINRVSGLGVRVSGIDMAIRSYRQLDVWQRAIELAESVYLLTNRLRIRKSTDCEANFKGPSCRSLLILRRDTGDHIVVITSITFRSLEARCRKSKRI